MRAEEKMQETELSLTPQVEEKSVKRKYVKQAINGIFALYQNDPKGKKIPLGIESVKVHVTVRFKKIPLFKTSKTYYLQLPHSLAAENTSICLIAANIIDKETRDTHDETIRKCKELLSDNGVTCINEVIASRQFLGEYKTYQAKRQVSCSHDVFLVDARLRQIANVMLGKEFFKRRKLPRFVNLKNEKLSAHIDDVLKRSLFYIPGNSEENFYEIGHMGQNRQEILENLLSSLECLKVVMPGGWNNIRALTLRYNGGKPIPFYYSGGSNRNIAVDLKKKKLKYVEDELSTMPDCRVRVYEDGTVRVIPLNKKKKSKKSEKEGDEVASESGEEAEDDDVDEEEEGDAQSNEDSDGGKAWGEGDEDSELDDDDNDKSVSEDGSDEEQEGSEESEEVDDSDEEEVKTSNKGKNKNVKPDAVIKRKSQNEPNCNERRKKKKTK